MAGRLDPPEPPAQARPTSAGTWDCLRGGRDNYAPDRDAVTAALRVFPGLADVAVASGRFVERAIAHVAGYAGVVQVLDLGAGFPAAGAGARCTHQVVHRVAPRARVVYADTDPTVLACRRARCRTDQADDAVTVADADLARPHELIEQVGRVLDLGRPVLVVLAHALTHLEHEDAASVAQALITPLAAGSHLVVAEPMAGLRGEPVQAALDAMTERGAPAAHARTARQMHDLLPGLALLKPGVVPVPLWQRPLEQEPLVAALGGVGRRMARGWWR